MAKERPLSPHLQVYQPQLTSVLSIFHRGTGIFLALGLPLLVWWLLSIASGPEAFNEFQQCASHWLARLFLLGWTFSLYYHLCNGLRHLNWDIGRGFEIKEVYTSGKIVLVASVLLTVVTWALAYHSLGGVS